MNVSHSFNDATKADDMVDTLSRWANQYIDGNTSSESGGIAIRFKVFTKDIRPHDCTEYGKGYTVGMTVESTVVKSKVEIRVYIYCRDSHDCFFQIPIDISSKKWAEFACYTLDSFHYLCRKQLSNAGKIAGYITQPA